MGIDTDTLVISSVTMNNSELSPVNLKLFSDKI